MPRKKRSDCDEHAKLIKIIKSRLIEISLKVDNYIYKQKPITKVQAKAFLDEITLCKSHCQNDTGYIQVIEKLTKFMNAIISNNTSESAIKGDTLSNGNVDASSNSTLTSINDNLSNPADKTSNNNRDSQNKSQNAADKQNTLELTSTNEFISGPKVENIKYASNKKYHNIVDKEDSVKETSDIEKGGVINTPSNVNGAHIECNEPNLLQFANNIEQGNEEYKDDDKTSTNIDPTLQIKNNVQSALKKDCRFLISVERGVINEIALMQNSNVAVLQQASEVNIPLNEFVFNNTKMADTKSETRPNIMQNILKNLNEEAISISVIEKPGNAKINNRKVKFTAPFNDLAEMSISEVINNKKLLSTTPLASSKKNNLPKKPRATKKNSAKNKKGNNAKESEGNTDKIIKRPAIKRKLKEPKNIPPTEVTPKTNDVNNKAENDLSWFDTIKYVRKVDEKEYFKPPYPLDDNFWCNPHLLLGDSKEFDI